MKHKQLWGINTKDMKKIGLKIVGIAMIISISACNQNKDNYDASGNFEAVETIISSQGTGVLKSFNLEEGQTLKEGIQIGYVDTLQLYLQQKQLAAKISTILGHQPNISVQLAVVQQEINAAEREKTRIENLLKGDAATPKQLDDINDKINTLKRQLKAQKSALTISSNALSKEVVPLKIKIAQIEDKLQKCKIINPINGTVLVKYAEEHEMTAVGKPLYAIANLKKLTLRVYITGNQLPNVKLNQKVKVLTDNGSGEFNHTEGIITWISSKAEFTPKSIQTKEERADKVYAMKISVPNPEGRYKIGMYGEVQF